MGRIALVFASRRRAQRAGAMRTPRRCRRFFRPCIFPIPPVCSTDLGNPLHTWTDGSHQHRMPKVLRSTSPQNARPISLRFAAAGTLDIQQKPPPQIASGLATGFVRCSAPGAPASPWGSSGLHSAVEISSGGRLPLVAAASTPRADVFRCRFLSSRSFVAAGSGNFANTVVSSRL